MKILKHPITSIREPFGKAGLIVACLALVFAMAGGALAAKGALTGKQKKEVAKIAQKEAKKFAGKEGKAGATGPAGATGAAGPQGPAGAKGDAGATGATGAAGPAGPAGGTGTPGAAGKSVTVTEIPTGEPGECDEHGGAVVEEEGQPVSATEVCNGAPGSPWTANGTLPTGSTENGAWTMMQFNTGGTPTVPAMVMTAISFPVPLAAALDESHVIAEEAGFSGSAGEDCPGSAAEPKAKAGFLCVYTVEHAGSIIATDPFIYPPTTTTETLTELLAAVPGTGTAGAKLVFPGTTGTVNASGTWAVTG